MNDVQPLLAYLREHDLLDGETEAQLATAEHVGDVRRALVESRLFTQRELLQLESMLSGYSATNNTTTRIDSVVRSQIPYEVARNKRIVCVDTNDKEICILTDTNNVDDSVLQALALKKPIRIEKTNSSHLDELLSNYATEDQRDLLAQIEQSVKHLRTIKNYGSRAMSMFFPSDYMREIAEDLSTKKLLKSIIALAKNKCAERIIFQSHSDKVIVQMIIIGELHDIMTLPKHAELSVLLTLQYLCDIPLGEVTESLSMKTTLLSDVTYKESLSVLVTPTVTGYTISLGMNQNNEVYEAAQSLGLSNDDTLVLADLFNQGTGSLLVTGLAGSGKTFAYYQLIQAGKTKGVTTSIEDVVEYVVDGINQQYWSRQPLKDIRLASNSSAVVGLRPTPHAHALQMANASQQTLVITETAAGVMGYLKALISQGLAPRNIANACRLNMVCVRAKKLNKDAQGARVLNADALATLENYCSRSRINEILREQGLSNKDIDIARVEWPTSEPAPRLWNKIIRGISGAHTPSQHGYVYVRALVNTEKIIASSYRKGQTLVELEVDIKEKQKESLAEVLIVRAYKHEISIEEVIAVLRT